MRESFFSYMVDALVCLLMFTGVLVVLISVSYACSAQIKHHPITLDMKVQRIPVSFMDNNVECCREPQLLSSTGLLTTPTIERIVFIFIDDVAVILLTERETMELIKTKIKVKGRGNNTLYYDPHNQNQLYWLHGAMMPSGHFRYWFVPLGQKEIYTYRSQSFKPTKVIGFKSKNLYAINIESL